MIKFVINTIIIYVSNEIYYENIYNNFSNYTYLVSWILVSFYIILVKV